MPMYNSDWQSALAALQPTMGNVQNPAKAGNSGNIPFSPGMMQGYQGPQVPSARDLYRGAYPGGMNNPLGNTRSTGYQQYPGGSGSMGGGMNGFQAGGFLDALRHMIAARGSVAATRGGGSGVWGKIGNISEAPGYGRGFGGGAQLKQPYGQIDNGYQRIDSGFQPGPITRPGFGHVLPGAPPHRGIRAY